ncbi:MAG: hypothetical protein AMJ43_00750 [Coxiella sp. DG_40]|nr:MAG: hypothetical protein AMJ43_00750 [Coxiella sp. DG_40]
MKALFYSITIFTIAVMFSQTTIANSISNKQYKTYHGKRAILRQVVLTPGSLRINIKCVARKFNWNKVIWNSPNDYRWVTYTKIRGANLQDILKIVLVNYPLQAVFYKGNHVLVIQSRTLR